jgi:tetratricopeptide (TPR) repeat protein
MAEVIRATCRGWILVAVTLLGCPSDPLLKARRLQDDGQLVAAAHAYLAVARRDPALLAAWDGAVDIQCRTRVDVAACLSVLDLELELLGTLQRHHDALASSLEARARARLLRGLVDAAQADLERAMAAAPDVGSIRAALARVALARGDRALARRRLREARDRDPRLPELEELFSTVHDEGAASDEHGFGGPEAEVP